MIFKSCLTCEFFKENVVKENSSKERYEVKVLEFDTAWCYHKLSEGKTSHDMIYNGLCGRDMKLWKRKGSLISEFEYRETE